MTDNRYSGFKVAFLTLGCKLNFAETSAIGHQLQEMGFEHCAENQHADVVVINTCSVTDTADKKGRQMINRMHAKHPDAFMIVTGCYAQLKPDEVAAIDGVDLVLGANEKVRFTDFIDAFDRHIAARTSAVDGVGRQTECHRVPTAEIVNFRPECSADDRTRHFLKVQDGCDYYCTYCTIPFARGRSRSASIADTVAVARKAVADGAREIVLSGVNTGDFGRRNGETFIDLLRALDTIDAEVRFRISSIEPNLLTDEIIAFVARSHHFAPHFHIPLQSGSDQVLRLMHRRYDTALFRSKIELIKQLMPHAFIGVDVMTGTRGETLQLFDESYNFISSLPLSQLHVFTYSERAGTKALDIKPIIPIAERRRRTTLLQQLSDSKLSDFYRQHIGYNATVLWEEAHGGKPMFGFTDNYIRLTAPANPAQFNTFQPIAIIPDLLALDTANGRGE